MGLDTCCRPQRESPVSRQPVTAECGPILFHRGCFAKLAGEAGKQGSGSSAVLIAQGCDGKQEAGMRREIVSFICGQREVRDPPVFCWFRRRPYVGSTHRGRVHLPIADVKQPGIGRCDLRSRPRGQDKEDETAAKHAQPE